MKPDLLTHYEPAVFAAIIDRMSALARGEARQLGQGPEALSLNATATQLHMMSLQMDGLSLRHARVAPAVDTRPTDGSL